MSRFFTRDDLITPLVALENTAEFCRLLTQYQPRLRGFVRCLLVRSNDVDDVLQEINIVLLRKSSQFQIGTDFWAWASTVARYEVLSYLRRKGREHHVLNDELIENLATVAMERLDSLDERRLALATCLEKLPAASRQLLEMRYSLSKSIGDIAIVTKRPEGSLRQTLHRIRRALYDCIQTRVTRTAQ